MEHVPLHFENDNFAKLFAWRRRTSVADVQLQAGCFQSCPDLLLQSRKGRL
jgi:hypothetical protein